MIALLIKETQSLVPHWLAVFAIVGLSMVFQLMGTDLTLDPLSSRVEGGETGLFLTFLLAFTIGHGLAAPEFVEGPIEFLDSLPLTRPMVFLAKVIAGALPCLGLIFSSLAVDLVLAQFGPAPPDTDVRPALIAAHLVFLSGAVAGLGLGLLLSWVRGLAWGVLLLGICVSLVVAVIQPGLQPYVPLASWGNLEFVNRSVGHPWGPLVFWTFIGIVSAGLSGLLFLGPGERFTRQGSWATGGMRLLLMGCLGTTVLSCSGFSLLGLLVQGPKWFRPVEMEQTEHFRVLYRAENAEHAQRLAAIVEELSAEVGGHVGNPHPLALDIELLGAPANHGGLFTGGKIRLQEDADNFTVAHELAHAHSFAVSGPSAWYQSSHTRFFEEGLASWAADRMMMGNPEIPLRAAAIHAVDPIAFDLLVEDAQFMVERDMAQAYPLGVAFVEALDDIGGAEARRCVLEGIGETGAARTAGLALWDGLARRCGFSLDDAIQRFEFRLEERAADLPPLPDLEATLADGQLRVVSTGAAMELVCRFRDMPETEVAHYIHVNVQDEVCEIPLWRLSGMTFEYQVGFRFEDDVVFDRWTTVPRP